MFTGISCTLTVNKRKITVSAEFVEKQYGDELPLLPYNYDGLFEVMNTITRLQKFIEGFIDYKVVISAHEQRTLKIHENYIELIRDELKEKVAVQSIHNFVGIKERSFQKTNIFDMYHTDKSIKKAEELLREIDEYIYDRRGA